MTLKMVEEPDISAATASSVKSENFKGKHKQKNPIIFNNAQVKIAHNHGSECMKVMC